MKASFAQRDIPVFLCLASRYAPVSLVDSTRKSLKVLALGFNQNKLFKETFDQNITALSALLNVVAKGLTDDSSCSFFEDNSIEFALIPSYERALQHLLAFKDMQVQPFSSQINTFLSNDLLNIVSVIARCKEIIKTRNDKSDEDKVCKKPLLKEIGEYKYLFVGQSHSALLKQKHNAPVIQAYSILKNSLRLDSISEDDFKKLHGLLETILIEGWGHYYKKIKIAFAKVDHNVRYTAILSKLELVGNNIINVSLVGRHSRQIYAIDIKHNFDIEEHRKMVFEIQSFFGNVFCLFIAYNYLASRVEPSQHVDFAATVEPVNQVIYTWTCGYCDKKYGSPNSVMVDHTISIMDASGTPQRAACPGSKHPPIEVGDSGLRIKAETEKSRYENAILELNALDTATSLMVIGKHSNRIFTPNDLSWNDRLTKAKVEKKATVDQLKAVHEQTDKLVAEWMPIALDLVPVWTGSNKKVA